MQLNCPPDEIARLASALEADTTEVEQNLRTVCDLYCGYYDAGDWYNADFQLRTLEQTLLIMQGEDDPELPVIAGVVADERENLNRELGPWLG